MKNEPSAMTCTFKVYEAGDGWRWNCTHQNSNILFGSSEGYSSKDAAMTSLNKAAEYLSLGRCRMVEIEHSNEDANGAIYMKVVLVD